MGNNKLPISKRSRIEFKEFSHFSAEKKLFFTLMIS